MKEFFTQIVQMIRLTARLYYIAKLSKAMKWLKIKLPLSCQICPVIDGRLTVECPCNSLKNKVGRSVKNNFLHYFFGQKCVFYVCFTLIWS